MHKVLVTDYVHQHLIEGLDTLGFTVEYKPDFKPEDLDEQLPELSGIVINSKIKMTRERMMKASKLKFIARLGSGLEIIDLDAAKEFGINVYNSPEGNRNAVAEHALGMLLSLSNKIIQSHHQVLNFNWDRESNRGFELENLTIGLIGMGNTGNAFASKLTPLFRKILFYDPYVENSKIEGVMKTDLQTLQKESDVISFHVQLTQETRYMCNADFLKACQKNPVIINTSRGKVLNTLDLISALEKQEVKGACLDVFENEKTNSYTQAEKEMYQKLLSMPNVVLSTHVAGWTNESLFKIADILISKIKSSL